MARQDASHLFGDEHVRSYRETGGELGHDWKEGTSVLLLTTTGRRSGEPRTTPLIYGTDERDFVIVASNGGSDEPPGWYANLEAEPEVEVQVLDDTLHRAGAHRDGRRAPRACGRRCSATGPTTRSTRSGRTARSPSSCSSAAEITIVPGMLLTFAASATSTTIVFILIWGILFPAFVHGPDRLRRDHGRRRRRVQRREPALPAPLTRLRARSR